MDNYWEYEVDGWRYELEFKYDIRERPGSSLDFKPEYILVLHRYESGKYVDSMDGLHWSLTQNDDTFILQIGSEFDFSYTYETFLLTSVSDSSFVTEAWFQHKKANIVFKQKTYPYKNWSKAQGILTSKEWHVSEVEYKKYEFDLAAFSEYADPLIFDMVLKEKDLHSNSLTYKFDSNQYFQLLKEGKVLQEGTWHLFPNGKILKLEMHRKPWDYYTMPDTYIHLLSLQEKVIKLKKAETYHTGDNSFETKETTQVWK